MLPQANLNLSLNYQRSSSTAGFALYNRNIGPFAGVSLSMPLFNGISVKRQLRLADRDLKAREIQLKLAENRLLMLSWRAVKNLETWLESLEREKETEKLGMENLSLVQERFRLGMSSSMELREAENQLENSRIRLQQFRYQARITGNQLLRIQAELDPEAMMQ